EKQAHRAREGVPFRVLGGKLPAALRGDPVVAGALAFVGALPRRLDPAFGLEAIERGAERAGLDLQQVLRGPLDVFGDGVGESRPGGSRPRSSCCSACGRRPRSATRPTATFAASSPTNRAECCPA